MQGFEKILLISKGIDSEQAAFKQALHLAYDYSVQLKILILYPELPETLSDYKLSYENALLENTEKRETLGASARAYVEKHFSIEQTVKVLREIYQSLSNSRKYTQG